MSPNPKELSRYEASEALIRTSKRKVDASLRELQKEMEQENTLVQETPAGRFQHVLRIYRRVKPLLSVLSMLPVVPAFWRNALTALSEALDLLATAAPDLTACFKAGKDL